MGMLFDICCHFIRWTLAWKNLDHANGWYRDRMGAVVGNGLGGFMASLG